MHHRNEKLPERVSSRLYDRLQFQPQFPAAPKDGWEENADNTASDYGDIDGRCCGAAKKRAINPDRERYDFEAARCCQSRIGQWGATSTHSSLVSPGQGGMVTAKASSGLSEVDRNWNDVPDSIVKQRPGLSRVTSS